MLAILRLLCPRLPPCSIFQDPATSHCGSGWTPSQLALYNAGTRPAWGVALILLCFVCFNGQVCEVLLLSVLVLVLRVCHARSNWCAPDAISALVMILPWFCCPPGFVCFF